jgi:hypothetical protein
MRFRLTAITGLAVVLSATAAAAQSPPFVTTLSNTTPLVFGMSLEAAAAALGTPLTYVSGRPGNEIFLTLRHNGGSGFFPRNDPLYLQFRRGHLTGWKGFWGQRWMGFASDTSRTALPN